MFDVHATIQSLHTRVPEGSTLVEFIRSQYATEESCLEWGYLDGSRDDTYEMISEQYSDESGVVFVAEYKFVYGQIDSTVTITSTEGELLYTAEYCMGEVTQERFL